MKKNMELADKKRYILPQIEQIAMDYEISLTIESPAPPPVWSENQEHSATDPFKTNVG